MDGTQLQQEEIMEIDLVRFCKKALLQWRAILCFGILFAVIVSGVQYVRAIGSYKTQLAAIAIRLFFSRRRSRNFKNMLTIRSICM